MRVPAKRLLPAGPLRRRRERREASGGRSLRGRERRDQCPSAVDIFEFGDIFREEELNRRDQQPDEEIEQDKLNRDVEPLNERVGDGTRDSGTSREL